MRKENGYILYMFACVVGKNPNTRNWSSMADNAITQGGMACLGSPSMSVVLTIERFSRAGPRGRGREWATLGEHPLTWLLSNNRLEKVTFVSVLHTSSNRLLLSNQDKGCTPSVAHSLPLPLGPALLNLWTIWGGQGQG